LKPIVLKISRLFSKSIGFSVGYQENQSVFFGRF